MRAIKKSAALLGMLLILSGCATGGQVTDKSADKEVSIKGVSVANPITADPEKKTITVLSRVNGKYFDEGTRHAVIYEGGKFGGKSVLTSLADQMTFYEKMQELGAKPGDNMKADTAESTHVQGDVIEPTFFWEGAQKDYKLEEIINDSNGKPFEMRFGGNQVNAKEKNTGCILCLDSCPVGLISNASYTYGAVEKRKEVVFTGKKEVLPKDGSYVAVTFHLPK